MTWMINGHLVINPKQAKIVERLYDEYLSGKTVDHIKRTFEREGIKNWNGKTVWQATTLKSMLCNEKYKGDAILQKGFTVGFLTKKKKINEGEVPQYYVENSHPAIITQEVFDLVQHEIKKRKDAKGYKTGRSCFSGKIVFGACGSFYGSKVWHSTSKYRRIVWQCNSKFTNAEKRDTTHLYEEKLKQAFVEAFNNLSKNKEQIFQDYEDIIWTLTDTSWLDKESARMQSEYEVVFDLMRKCVEENVQSTLDQAEYQLRYSSLAERYENLKKKMDEIDDERLERKAKHENIGAFIRTLELNNKFITEFDEELWIAAVEMVTVYFEHDIAFTFKDGLEYIVNTEPVGLVIHADLAGPFSFYRYCYIGVTEITV
jgi:site-specific DNA recombinase